MADYKTFLQYDSRWGRNNYNGSSTMAMAGCGPTSVAMLAYAIDKKVTPWTVAKYMRSHGYAIRNQGTAWDGIPAAMKEFGLKDVKNVSAMSNVFKYIKKRYCAVFLTSYKYAKNNGAPMNTIWTTSGHFVAVTNYKVKNGKHYFYVRDGGGRGHTGWYCYETQMRGWLREIWVGYVPGNLKTKKPKKKTVKKTVKKTKAQKVNELAVECAYAYGTSSSKFKYPSGKPKKKYKETLAKAFPNRSGWDAQKKAGAKCEIYVCAVLRALGIAKSMPTGLAELIKYLEKHDKEIDLVPSKKDDKGHYYSPSMLKGGDIVIVEYKGTGGHIFFIVEVNGKLYISEAQWHGKTYPHISKVLKTMRKSSYEMLRVYRVKE